MKHELINFPERDQYGFTANSTEGGWVCNKRGVFTDKLKIKWQCELCKNKFVVTKTKNNRSRRKAILVNDTDVKYKRGFINPLYYEGIRNMDIAIEYCAKCPYCQHIDLDEIMNEKIDSTKVWIWGNDEY